MKHPKVESRNESFTKKIITKISDEEPSSDNPYITENIRYHGYDLFELLEHRSFIDVLYLLFRGELPNKEEVKLLESLMIGLINPGPRHPATRAAMNAGVGKTDPVHILPIALTIFGGKHSGAGDVEESMRFLRKNCRKPVEETFNELQNHVTKPEEGDWHIAPGFGSRFGDIDLIPTKLANKLRQYPAAGKTLNWAHQFTQQINPINQGWLTSGIAAATFCDLGFQPRYGGALLQLICAPGLLAQGLELSNKPVTAFPFVDDENYFIETE